MYATSECLFFFNQEAAGDEPWRHMIHPCTRALSRWAGGFGRRWPSNFAKRRAHARPVVHSATEKKKIDPASTTRLRNCGERPELFPESRRKLNLSINEERDRFGEIPVSSCSKVVGRTRLYIPARGNRVTDGEEQ